MYFVSKLHLKATKRVISYIKDTSDLGVKFTRINEYKLVGFCDGDWKGSVDDMRSTSNYCFTFRSSVFLRSSKKQ